MKWRTPKAGVASSNLAGRANLLKALSGVRLLANFRRAHRVPRHDFGQGCGGTLPEDPDNAAGASRSTVREKAVLRLRRHG